MPKKNISVIVPVFNTHKYLATLLQSILNQSEKSIEIIAINDGSTDSCGKILQDMASTDSRLVVINTQNNGQSAARNLGIQHAKGKWIAFADSDDWLAPYALETWLKQAEENNLDFLLGNGFRFISNPIDELTPPNILLNQAHWDEVITGKDWIIKCVASNKWPHLPPLQFIKNELIITNNLQFKEGIVHEDILWTLNLALSSKRIGYCPTSFYGYRRTPNSTLTSTLQESIIHRAKSYLIVFDGLITAAKNTTHSSLRKSLFRHLNFEVNNFMTLVRKKIIDPAKQQKLAKRALSFKIMLSMLRGSQNVPEIWRTIRCWIFLYQIILSPKTKPSLR